jgi:ABC-type Fe3+-hydroxamate transport system substrate-binding protein
MARSLEGPRLVAAFASLLLILGTVAGCGSGTGSTPAKKGESAAGDSAAGHSTYPVTIPNKYGSTTITAEPQRIVTVGLTDQGGTEHTHGIASTLLSNTAVRAGEIHASIVARRTSADRQTTPSAS